MAKSVPYAERKFDRKHQMEYNTEYQKNNYDRINVVLPKGYKDIVYNAAESNGTSVAKWIKSLIDKELGL